VRTTMLVLLLGCGTAQASEWVSLGKGSDASTDEFIDVSSILVAGDIRRTWIKSVVAPHSQKGDGKNANKWVSYGLMRPAFNCVEGTSRLEAALIFFADGTNETATLPAFIAEKSKPVPPDTVEHNIMQQVCAWKPN
jgi:hypothetical protein